MSASVIRVAFAWDSHNSYLYYPKTNLSGFFQSAAAAVNVIKEPIDVYKIAKAINSVRTL